MDEGADMLTFDNQGNNLFTALAKSGHLWTLNFVYQLVWCVFVVPLYCIFWFLYWLASAVNPATYGPYVFPFISLFTHILLTSYFFLCNTTMYVVTVMVLRWPWS